MYRKSLCVLAATSIVLSASLMACGSSTTAQTQQQEATSETAETTAQTTETTETTQEAQTPAATESGTAAQVTELSTAAVSTPQPEPEPEPELPRSPLTGLVMDEELLKQRPLAVMYPINKQAQPQYGLDRVDVFYEIMEEGSMSRQMGIMQDWQGLDRIGNIRSIRSYFVYEALEWDPIIIHFGGPVDYTGEILTRDDVDNINGVGGVMGSDYGAFYRIPHDGVAIEHTAYTDSEHINDAIDEAGFEREHREEYYNPKHFTFAKDGEVNTLSQYPDAVDATEVDMAGSYPVTQSALYYNEDDHKYYKTLYGEDQVDGETGNQLAFDNIFIQRAEWVYANNDSREWEDGTHGYLWFRITDPGYDGFYITNGKMIHVTWNKDDEYTPTIYYDDNGNEVTVNQGKTMIFIIRDDRDDFEIDGVTYYPDDHSTLTATESEERAADGATEEETAPAEEPENEEM